MTIFLDGGDYRKFLYLLADVVDMYDVEVWDFCLMPNHYHLALCNRKPNLSRVIQHLNGEYGLWWNAQHRTVGHVFQGRFKDQIVQHVEYLETLVRYIALNPVRAKLASHPGDWHWSAFRSFAGLSPTPGFLCADRILDHLGGSDLMSRRNRYVRHVVSPGDDYEAQAEQLRSKQRVLGDRAFKAVVMETRDGVPH